VALFAISYDTVEVLRGFAATHGITYPLLADEGSHVMRALGLINERVQEDHAAYGIAANPRHVNLPYPGVFLLDGAGVVAQKRFFESYRERDTGPGLLAQALGVTATAPASVAPTGGPVLTARAWVDSPTYAFFQRLTLFIDVSIAPGLRVYGAPAQGGITPLSVEVGAIEGLEVGVARWPAPQPLSRAGLADTWVYSGVVRGTLPLTFAASPGGGDQMLEVTVHFQNCDEAGASVPSSMSLQVPVREAPLVGRSLPKLV
jgi:hypothetical protein